MFKANWVSGAGDITIAEAIREEVFCDEQGYSCEAEYDDMDKIAQHLIVIEDGEPVATGRLFEKDGVYMLGRIAVRKRFRNQGFGDMVVRLMLDKALGMGAEQFYISSQEYIKDLYCKFGFRQRGDSYCLAGDTRNHVDLYASADEIVFPSECAD